MCVYMCVYVCICVCECSLICSVTTHSSVCVHACVCEIINLLSYNPPQCVCVCVCVCVCERERERERERDHELAQLQPASGAQGLTTVGCFSAIRPVLWLRGVNWGHRVGAGQM